MGGWLEVLRERPPAGADDGDGRRPFVLGEIACHPLILAGRHLGREHRDAFPALARIRVGSPAYDGEELWIDAQEGIALLAEFRRLRRIVGHRESLPGLDARRYGDVWRAGEPPESFEAALDRIEAILARIESGGWVYLTL